jgi:hypothetical protein
VVACQLSTTGHDIQNNIPSYDYIFFVVVAFFPFLRTLAIYHPQSYVCVKDFKNIYFPFVEVI